MLGNSREETKFEHLSLDETLRRTVSVYRKGFAVFTGIAALILGLCAVLWVAIFSILLTALHVTVEELDDPTYRVNHFKEVMLILAPKILLNIVLGAITQGMVIKAVSSIYSDKDPSFCNCLKLGFKKTGIIILTTFVVLVITQIGSLFFIIPGLYLSVMWLLVDPTVVIEDKGILESMKRSWHLVSGNWCYVFCTYLIFTVFALVVQLSWDVLVVGGIDVNHTSFSIVGSTLTLIPGIVFVPLLAIVRTVMYFNLRAEEEGLKFHALSCDLDGGAYSPLMEDVAEMGP